MNKPRRLPCPPPPMPPSAPAGSHWMSAGAAEWRPIPSVAPEKPKPEREQRLEQLLGLSGFGRQTVAPVEHTDEWGQAHRTGYHELRGR